MSHMRQTGKSAALGAAYGMRQKPEHPLQFVSGYQFVECDKRLGGTAIYRAATKIVSEIMSSKGQRVPHTECYYRMLDELDSVITNDVAAIAWIRRSKRADLEQAVATLLMLGKTPVLVRAFKTDKECAR